MKKIMKITLSILIMLVFAFGNTVNSLAQNVIAGVIPTTHDVSSSGAFQYTVPLRMPPGIKGIIPNLGITYNSHTGNGLMGVGWSLTGLSAITRGQGNIYYNLNVDPIDFDNNDVLYLDGSRLFSTSSGFMTEVKNFATIQSHGIAGNGPSYFTVEYPNGTIYEYGNSVSSKMVAQGKTEVLMWPVNKVTDVHGNYIIFEYTNIQSTGEHRISSITYGENSNTASGIPISINFSYTSRQDENIIWFAGAQVKNNVLLEDIEIKFSNNTQANKYHFTYDFNKASRLVKIEELRDGNDILTPININWGNNSQTVNPINVPNNLTRSATFTFPGDFNGDGYTDFVENTNGTAYVNINNGNNTFTQSSPTNAPLFSSSNATYGPRIKRNNQYSYAKNAGRSGVFFDYDGDGLDDVITINYFNAGVWIVGQGLVLHPFFDIVLYKANGNPTTVFDPGVKIFSKANGETDNVNFNALTFIKAGDYDGDGKSELLVVAPYHFNNTNSVKDYEMYIVGDEYGNHSPYHSHQIYHFSPGHINGAMVLDYNGDGKDEFLFTHDFGNVNAQSVLYGLDVSYNSSTLKPVLNQTPTQWPLITYSTSGLPHTYLQNWIGDFNGDAKDDIIFRRTQSPMQWSMVYSNGAYDHYQNTALFSSLNTPTSPIQNLSYTGATSYSSNYSMHIADFNGDGLSDILQLEYAQGTTTYRMYYSGGTNNFTEETGTYPGIASYEANTIGDFNGDGQADILYISGTTCKIITFYENNTSLKVTSIEHAGKTVSVEYKPLTQDAQYTASTTLGNDYTKKTFALNVVKRLYDNVDLDNKYTYEGFASMKYGVGGKGFTKFSIENKAGQNIYKTYNVTAKLPYLIEEILYDAYNGALFGKKIEYDRIDEDGGANGMSRIIIPYASRIEDNITGYIEERTFTTGSTATGTVFYDYGKIEIEETRTKDLNGGNNSLETTTYDYGMNWVANRGQPISITRYSDIDPNGNNSITRTKNISYNGDGTVLSNTTDPGTSNEKTAAFTYDVFGNVTQTTVTANGISASIIDKYTYTTDGKFITTEENAMGYTTTNSYNPLSACWGNVIQVNDKHNIDTYYEYDVLNRQKKVTDVHGVEETTIYEWAPTSQYSTSDPNEQILAKTTTTASSQYNIAIYDKYGRIIRKIKKGFSGTDIFEDLVYNSNGQVVISRAPYPANTPAASITTTTTYDPYNREVQRSISNGGSTIQTTYSIVQGLMNATTSDLGTGKTKTSVTCGGTLRRLFSNSEDITYTYYGNGQTATTTTNGLSFNRVLDPFGRLKEKTEPNGGTIKYEYDALSRLTKETLATNEVFDYSYDVLGRVKTKTLAGATNSYVYEYEDVNGLGATGELIKETVPNGNETEYAYTNNNKLDYTIEKTNGRPDISTHYAYDLMGRLEYIYYYNDITLKYSYRYTGHLNEVELVNGSGQLIPHKLWHANDRNHLGQLEGAYYYDQNNNQLYHSLYVHDAHGYAVSREMLHIPNMMNVAKSDYISDPQTGNILERKDVIRNFTETFTYDTQFDRLTSIVPSGAGVNASPVFMSYDDNGNVLKKSDITSSPFDFRYNNYALLTVPEPATSMPGFQVPSNTQDVEYHPFKKVKKVTEAGQNEVVFEYGAGDVRVKAEYYDLTSGTSVLDKTKYYAHNYEVIEDKNGKTELNYVWANEELIAIFKIHTPIGSQTSQGDIYYPFRDHLGSITHILDDKGTGGAQANGLIEERSYDAWGRVRNPNDWSVYTSNQNNFPTANWQITDRGYTGHEHLIQGTWDNNIINMNGRLYDPLIGRMFSPDPVIVDNTNTQDYNKYAYARNNPLKYIDPDGNVVFTTVAIIAFGAFANLAANASNIRSFGDGAMYFGIGALGSFAGSGIAGAVGGFGYGGFIGGFAGGAAAGSAVGLLRGAGNAWVRTGSLGAGLGAGASSAMTGGVAGGLLGGLSSGLLARSHGANFWRGASLMSAYRQKPHLTGNPVKDPEKFFKDNFNTKSFSNKQPRFIYGSDDVDAFVLINGGRDAMALTYPDNTPIEPVSSTVYVTSKAMLSDKELFQVLDHEFWHILYYANGQYAQWFLSYRNQVDDASYAASLATAKGEAMAYMHTIFTAAWMKDQSAVDNAIKELNAAREYLSGAK
ncbi:MAG: FG-GAP-like repeat-containing protein [Flavipsychrobacter sp.]